MSSEDKQEQPALMWVFPNDCMLHGHGHHARFVAGEPGCCPASLHPEALKHGGKPLNGVAIIPKPPVVKVRKNISSEEKSKLIGDVLRAIATTNKSEDFGANGRPKIDNVRNMLGFSITLAERNEVWAALKEELNRDSG